MHVRHVTRCRGPASSGSRRGPLPHALPSVLTLRLRGLLGGVRSARGQRAVAGGAKRNAPHKGGGPADTGTGARSPAGRETWEAPRARGGVAPAEEVEGLRTPPLRRGHPAAGEPCRSSELGLRPGQAPGLCTPTPSHTSPACTPPPARPTTLRLALSLPGSLGARPLWSRPCQPGGTALPAQPWQGSSQDAALVAGTLHASVSSGNGPCTAHCTAPPWAAWPPSRRSKRSPAWSRPYSKPRSGRGRSSTALAAGAWESRRSGRAHPQSPGGEGDVAVVQAFQGTKAHFSSSNLLLFFSHFYETPPKTYRPIPD